MEAKLQELRARLAEVNDLGAAGALLHWDQATYMPPGGAEARGRQLATLGKLSHEKFTDPAIGKLLDALKPYEESLPFDSDDASLIRVARRDYEKATKVPSEFAGRLSAHAAATFDAWTRARPANDFRAVQSSLEAGLDLSREYASFFPGYESIADPLIDQVEEGMKASAIRELFTELRAQLVPIVQAITSQPPADESCLRHYYPEAEQREAGLEVIRQFGYDFERGRQDKTHHPFMTKFSLGDVRITTRYSEEHLGMGFFATLHEAGHALYEQGIRRELEATPLAEGASSGVHESQSRLWENLVGRSRGFWEWYYPTLQDRFPQQLGAVPLDAFYAAINNVQRSLIRVEADEVTYNLHIMIRFDLEMDLLEGRLAVGDLPEAWRERYRQDLGIAPPDDRDGVLQDVHWYSGLIGSGFQSYTLGNILGAQLFDAAVSAHPHIPEEIARGEFGALRGWLTEHLYQHGRKFTPDELIRRATGTPMRIEPYIGYLRRKFGELYSL